MKSKKGYTLIEVLGIILLLAVIALIAIPFIIGITEKAKMNSFKDSVYRLLESADLYAVKNRDKISENGLSFSCNGQACNHDQDTLKFNGKVPTGGEVQINQKYESLSHFITDGQFCAYGYKKDLEVAKSCSKLDRTPPEIDPSKLLLRSTATQVFVNLSRGFATDPESDIDHYIYEIYSMEDIFIDSITSPNLSAVFKNLQKDTTYKVKVIAVNGNNLSSSITGEITTKDSFNPVMTQIDQSPNDKDDSGKYIYQFATKRTIRIDYVTENLFTPRFFIQVKNSSSATINKDSSAHITAKCDIKNNIPVNCTDTDVSILEENQWYQVTGDQLIIDLNQNAVLYASIFEEDNLMGSSNGTFSKIDTTPPSATIDVDSKKTDRVTLTAKCTDPESGILKYEFSKDGGQTFTSSYSTNKESQTHTFTKLSHNKEYQFFVRCTNGAALTKTTSKSGNTAGLNAPDIQGVRTPSVRQYPYAQKVVETITYNSTDVDTPHYFFKSSVEATVPSGTIVQQCGANNSPQNCSNVSVTTLVPNTWYRTNNKMPSITYTKAGTLYAILGDGTNITSASTDTFTKIDPTPPTISLSLTNVKTDRVTMNATCTDADSGVDSYQFWLDTDSQLVKIPSEQTRATKTYTGLIKNHNYKFNVKCTNKSGLTAQTAQSKSTLGMNNPSITEYSQTPYGNKASNTNYHQMWARSRTMKITYSNTNIVSPNYYFRSTKNTTLFSGQVRYACGTGSSPSTTCTAFTGAQLSANTWYKASSLEIYITYLEDATLYAYTSDGTNVSGTASSTISKIDTSAPSASSLNISNIKTNAISVTAKCADSESGIKSVEFSKDGGSTYVGKINSSSSYATYNMEKTYTFTGLSSSSSYIFRIRCTNGADQQSQLGTTPVSTAQLQNPDIKETSTGTWATSRKFNVTYKDSTRNPTVENANYYIKTSTSAYASQGGVGNSCGTGNSPSICNGSDPFQGYLSPNTWYKVTSQTLSGLLFSGNATITALISDGTNTAQSTFNVTHIDATPPSAPVITSANNYGRSFNFSITTASTDTESGLQSTVCQYATSSSGPWTSGTKSGNGCYFNNVSSGTTYYYRALATDKAGNSNTSAVKSVTTYTGVNSGSYAVGSTVSYAGKSWTVISDSGSSKGSYLKLALNGTAGTGTYNNSKTYLANNFLKTNTTLNNDSNRSGLIAQSGYYVTSDSNTTSNYSSVGNFYWSKSGTVVSSEQVNSCSRGGYTGTVHGHANGSNSLYAGFCELSSSKPSKSQIYTKNEKNNNHEYCFYSTYSCSSALSAGATTSLSNSQSSITYTNAKATAGNLPKTSKYLTTIIPKAKLTVSGTEYKATTKRIPIRYQLSSVSLSGIGLEKNFNFIKSTDTEGVTVTGCSSKWENFYPVDATHWGRLGESSDGVEKTYASGYETEFAGGSTSMQIKSVNGEYELDLDSLSTCQVYKGYKLEDKTYNVYYRPYIMVKESYTSAS